MYLNTKWAWLVIKNLPAMQETWVLSLEKEIAPTPVFLPGGFHGHRSLAGDSPWSHKESDMTHWLTLVKAKTVKNQIMQIVFQELHLELGRSKGACSGRMGWGLKWLQSLGGTLRSWGGRRQLAIGTVLRAASGVLWYNSKFKFLGKQECVLNPHPQWPPATHRSNYSYSIKYVCIYLLLAVLGLHCCSGFSLVPICGAYTLVVVCMGFSSLWPLLLWSTGSRCMGLSSCNSQTLEHRLNGYSTRA